MTKNDVQLLNMRIRQKIFSSIIFQGYNLPWNHHWVFCVIFKNSTIFSRIFSHLIMKCCQKFHFHSFAYELDTFNNLLRRKFCIALMISMHSKKKAKDEKFFIFTSLPRNLLLFIGTLNLKNFKTKF